MWSPQDDWNTGESWSWSLHGTCGFQPLFVTLSNKYPQGISLNFAEREPEDQKTSPQMLVKHLKALRVFSDLFCLFILSWLPASTEEVGEGVPAGCHQHRLWLPPSHVLASAQWLPFV